MVDEVAAELGGEALPKGVEGVRNPSMHRGASCAKMVENYQDARWPRSAQGVMPLKVIAVLMPFGQGRCASVGGSKTIQYRLPPEKEPNTLGQTHSTTR